MALFSKKSLPHLLVPAAVSLAVLLLALTPLIAGMDRALYDLWLRAKPSPPPSEEFLFLDVDDRSIDKVGEWPWPRYLMAEGLVSLRELGLSQAVFDIEYLNPSPPGINLWYLNRGLQRDFNHVFDDINTNVTDLFLQIQEKQIPLKAAGEYASELGGLALESGKELYEKSRSLAVNSDLFLGEAMAYFGATTITLNIQDSDLEVVKKVLGPQGFQTKEKLLKQAEERFSLPFLGQEGRPWTYNDFYVPLEELVLRAKSAGLTNVKLDQDGKRRRIRLFESVGGKWYGQLGFVPLLEKLGHPEVTIAKDSVTLKDARYPDGSTRTLQIPLDPNGYMLINWQKTNYLESFRHLPFYRLVEYKEFEDKLVTRLISLSQADSWRTLRWKSYNTALDLADAYDAWREVRDAAVKSGVDEDVKASVAQKEAWVAQVGDFLEGPIPGQLTTLIAQIRDESSGDDRALLEKELTSLQTTFSQLQLDWKNFSQTKKELSSLVQGKTAFVGVTSTGSTDLGATPFFEAYPLLGTHVNVVNTIFSGQFLTETPSWLSLVLAPLLAFALVFLLRNLPPLQQNLAGIGVVVGAALFGLGLFVFAGVFVALTAPLLAMFVSFVAYSLVRFLGSEQEKAFITKAFSTYLSPDVIDEIVQDPSKMKLGGDNKWMTAMFTDVKGFSTISEKLTAPELVHLLNEYLTGMSDIVLDEKGTIDKYEGDAIIAFFGAPIDLPDHAARACLAAIRMRQAEIRMNPGFLERKMTPVPLMTRIGINTGEMVVGNMGTERKMNYTIMGNAVNLSARLEGVNKQYGTWILTTEYTAKEAGETFLFRRLDRVRVVGINTPIRLMNLLGLKEEEGDRGRAMVEEFHRALEVFEDRRWAEAASLFQELSAKYPEDGPSQLYAKRCQAILAGTSKVSEDGVFNLTEK